MLEYVGVWMGSVFGSKSHHTLQLIFVIGTCINFIRSMPKSQNKINEIFNIKKKRKRKRKALHFWSIYTQILDIKNIAQVVVAFNHFNLFFSTELR